MKEENNISAPEPGKKEALKEYSFTRIINLKNKLSETPKDEDIQKEPKDSTTLNLIISVYPKEISISAKEKNKNESRIRYLERMIRTAKVVEDNSGDDEVGINKTVTVYVEEDGVEEDYKIVTTVREDSLNGLVSNESPMGKALMGHKVGDRVEITVSKDYSYYVVIRKIDNSTIDEAGDLRNF